MNWFTRLCSVGSFVGLCALAAACKTRNPEGASVKDADTEAAAAAAAAAAADPTAATPNPELTRAFDLVSAALEAEHGGAKKSTWEVTSATLEPDWLMQTPAGTVWDSPQVQLAYGTPCTGSEDVCDADFQLTLCQTDQQCTNGDVCRPVLASVLKPGDAARSMCVGTGDYVYEKIYTELVKAEKTIDIISLSPPDGRYRKAIMNALVFLNNAGKTPDVRLLFGGKDSIKPNFQKPQTVLTEWLPIMQAKKADYSLPVACAWLSIPTSLAWNHSKIIAVDGAQAIVGGQNFWERVYLQPGPVFDMSVQVSGPAALAATRFADALWNMPKLAIGVLPESAQVNLHHADGLTELPAGPVKMIGVGRLGRGDNAADTAIEALLGSAQHSIRISQQDLYSIMSPLKGPFGLDQIADAAIRGVDIFVIKSSVVEATGYGMVGPEETFDRVGRAIEKKAKKFSLLRRKGNYAKLVCDKLHIARLRYSAANLPDGQVKSHTKLIMVDDQAFYIGSQNIYNANLQEYGYMIFDQAAGAEMLRSYWEPAWKHSSEAQVACKVDPKAG